MSDREVILAELKGLYASHPETPEQMFAMTLRIKELQRALQQSSSSVRVDRNLLGSLAETPPPIDNDDEEWRGDPMLRHMHEAKENWK